MRMSPTRTCCHQSYSCEGWRVNFLRWWLTASVGPATQGATSRTWASCRALSVWLADMTTTKTLSRPASNVRQATLPTATVPRVHYVTRARALRTILAICKLNVGLLVPVSMSASVWRGSLETANGVHHGQNALSAAPSRQGSRTPLTTVSAALSSSAWLASMRCQLLGTPLTASAQAARLEATVHPVSSVATCAPPCTRTTTRILPHHARQIWAFSWGRSCSSL